MISSRMSARGIHIKATDGVLEATWYYVRNNLGKFQ